MSTIRFSNNKLVFRVRDIEEEVGYLEESESGGCVLWLKDIFGLLSDEGEAYYRADEYASMNSAKIKAVEAVSVQIWHLMWMRKRVEHEAKKQFASEGESILNKVLVMLGRLPKKDITVLVNLIYKTPDFIEKIKTLLDHFNW